MWEVIKDWIEEYVLLKYNPDRHALPPRQTKRRTSGQTEYYNLAGHSLVGGQLWTPDMEDNSKTADAAWKQADVRTMARQGQETLTESDMIILKERKLNVKKAMLIKPYWVKGFSRTEISAILSRIGDRRVKGYSEATVGNICAALSYSADRGEELRETV